VKRWVAGAGRHVEDPKPLGHIEETCPYASRWCGLRANSLLQRSDQYFYCHDCIADGPSGCGETSNLWCLPNGLPMPDSPLHPKPGIMCSVKRASLLLLSVRAAGSAKNELQCCKCIDTLALRNRGKPSSRIRCYTMLPKHSGRNLVNGLRFGSEPQHQVSSEQHYSSCRAHEVQLLLLHPACFVLLLTWRWLRKHSEVDGAAPDLQGTCLEPSVPDLTNGQRHLLTELYAGTSTA
jgi:hypothetical protein